MPLFRGKEILILEDAADLLLQMRQVLGADGALVEDTRTARSGLASAQEILPHLIIIDLALTGGGALQFLQDFKKLPHLGRIPLLVLGKAREKEIIVRATQLGAADCLLKPFTAALLIEKVEKLLIVNPYQPHRFEDADRLKVRITVPAEIVTMDEGGFRIEAPVMLGRESEIKIDAPLLDQLGCSNAHTRTTARAPRPAAQGGYLNEINLLGIGPKVAKTIREFLRERAAEGISK
jgi:two-component system chemotaxis response regulator CheY